MTMLNTAKIPKEFVWQDTVGLITQSLEMAGGSEKIYVNIDTVPPKAYSAKYHCHSQQEEFFLILSGMGTIRLNNKEYPIKAGDFFAKPAAKNIAHTFYYNFPNFVRLYKSLHFSHVGNEYSTKHVDSSRSLPY